VEVLSMSVFARRITSALVFALPGAIIVITDALRRWSIIMNWEAASRWTYFATTFVTFLLWGALCRIVAHAPGMSRWLAYALLVMGAGLAWGGQNYLFGRFHCYVNERAVLVGASMMPSVGQQVRADANTFSLAVGPPLVLVSLLPFALRKISISNLRKHLDLAVFALLGAFTLGRSASGSEQAATPDVLYFSALTGLAQAKWEGKPSRLLPGARSPLPVPTLIPAPPVPRNVLLVVTESVRASDVCKQRDLHCRTTPFTQRATEHRFDLEQMRALDSTTAISLAVMWSGVPVEGSREAFHEMPLVWEYGRAAGFRTAYWTAQNLLFANSAMWLAGVPLDKTVSATEIDPEASYEIGAPDGELVERALSDLDTLAEPFVGVVHLSNTHYPYAIDERDAPFQPQRMAFGRGDNEQIHNRYKDAIYAQDRHIARLVETVRSRPYGQKTVVVFTSDHGEQMRERGAVSHASTMLDAEIHVPFWVDAPEGTLSERERASLRSLRQVPVTQVDVLPSLLDLMGVLDSEGIASLRAKMPGRSLLRGGSDPSMPVFLSNCSEIFACAFRNWGAMRGTKKIWAMEGDAQWSCLDIASDPFEEQPLPLSQCNDLVPFVERVGKGAPFR
jgi:hypothetical protein